MRRWSRQRPKSRSHAPQNCNSTHISGGDGAGGAVGRVVRAGGAALSPAWEGAAAGGSRAHAADLLFAAVVQPVGPGGGRGAVRLGRSEEHTSELQSHSDLVCRLLLEKKKTQQSTTMGGEE